MEILYANVIEKHAYWGAEWFMTQALHRLGHHTHCVDYRVHRKELFRTFRHLPQCDAFLLQRGDHFPHAIVQAVTVPRFFWVSELVARQSDFHHLLRQELFSHVFFRTPRCIEQVVDQHWLQQQQCSILLSAFDESVHRPLAQYEENKDIDVLFIGSLNDRRSTVLEQVSQHFHLKVVSAFGSEMVAWVNRAKIILNIHASDYPDTETRVFEVLGCGGFLLSETLSQENPFTSSHLVQFNGVRELLEKIDYYLNDDESRRKVARQGHIEAISNHTYLQRAKQLINTISAYRTATNTVTNIVSPPVVVPNLKYSALQLVETVSTPLRPIISKLKRKLNHP